MIVLERFIYGLFKNTGYKTIYTSQVKKILKKESLEKLKNLRLKKGQSTDTVTIHFPSQNIITRSYLQSTRDIHGREGILNHTVIMKTTDFFQEFPDVVNVAFNLIEEPPLMNLSDPPKSLEPLQVETK